MQASKSTPGEMVSMLDSVKINLHLPRLAVLSVVLRDIRTTAQLTNDRIKYIGLSG